MSSSMPPSRLLLISDESSVETSPDDAFGHDRYVSALANIVLGQDTGHTIALFGRYGSGKTWIVKRLRKRLEDHRATIGFVEYNVWRFADEEIRRDFLLTLRDNMQAAGLFKNRKIPDLQLEQFTTPQQNTIANPPRISWVAFFRALVDSWILGVLLVAILTLGAWVLASLAGLEQPELIGAAALVAAFAWVTEIFRATLSPNRFSIQTTQVLHRPKVELPEQFRRMFETIVKARNTTRLVIVLDNVDRCTPEAAMRVLSMVKNFLEPTDPQIFFLIPCDGESLHRHMTALFVSKGVNQEDARRDASEYIGKFFGSSVAVLRFEDVELQKLAESELRSMKLAERLTEQELDGVAAITATANRESPRAVKVFLNKVASRAMVMEASGLAAPTLDIAKLLAIEERAQKVWDEILANPSYLREAEHAASSLSTESLTPTERRLLNALKWHAVDELSIRAIVGLREPPGFEGIPRASDLFAAIDDADLDVAVEIANLTPEDKRGNLLRLTSNRTHEVADRNLARAANPASVGLGLVAHFEFPDFEVSNFLNTLTAEALTPACHKLPPQLVAIVAQRVPTSDHKRRVRSELLTWLGETDDPIQKDVLDALDSLAEELTTSEVASIREKVDAAIARSLTFEQHLRGVSPDVRIRFVPPSAIQPLLDNYKLPETAQEAPATTEAMTILRNHACLLNQEACITIAKRAETYGLLRLEASGFDSIIASLMKEVVELARQANSTPLDIFGDTIQAIIAKNDPVIFQAVAPEFGPFEPALAGRGRAGVVQLASVFFRGQAGLPEDTSCQAGDGILVTFSTESKREVAMAVASQLDSVDSDALLERCINWAAELNDWTMLNAVLTKRLDRDRRSFQWAQSRIQARLSDLEHPEKAETFGSIPDRVHSILTAPDQVKQWLPILVELKPYWPSDLAPRLAETLAGFFGEADSALLELVTTAVRGILSECTRETREAIYIRALAAITDGPLGIAAPTELFNLQLEAIEHVSYVNQLQIRGTVTGILADPSQDHARAIELGIRLAKNGNHSDSLLQPAVDCTLQLPEERRGPLLGLLENLDPSLEAVKQHQPELEELSSVATLPPKLRSLLDQVAGAGPS